MQNHTRKTGYQNNRVPHSGRRQQIQNGTRYGDGSNGEKRALLVQRNDLVNSKTGLKSKSFVPAKRIEICASTNSGKDDGQRIPPLLSLNPNARSCKQNNRNSRNADVTNNSSNKRSYFEPYDPRRSPGVRNNGNIGAQPGPAMCQYVQPYQQFNYYQQFPGPHNGFQYQRVQAPNAATAVAPNGETIYIPLDDRQYEIKKDNHDLYDMPDGCELLRLESAGEFESSVQLISSPRPVDLKGGLSQDSRSDSGESSDEISYGEPDTDSDSESESEFVENCVSDVLKTIAESVQNITVEESKDIVQRALKDFEDSQETATERNVLEAISNDSKTTLPNTCKSVTKSETESDITSRHSSNVTKPRTLDNCFGLTESHDLTKPQSLQRKKQHFVERTIINDLFEKSEPYSTNDDCKSGPVMDKKAIISESTPTKVVSSNSDVHTHINMTRTTNTVKPWSNDVHQYNNASRKAKPRRKQTEITNVTSKNDTSTTCNKPKLVNKQNKCETMFRPSVPGGVFEKQSGPAINSKSNSKRGTSVTSTSQHNSVPDSLKKSDTSTSEHDFKKYLPRYNDSLSATNDMLSQETNISEPALGYDRDNTHDNCRNTAPPNEWLIQGQQEPLNFQYPLNGNYSPVGASNEWNSRLQPEVDIVSGHNTSEFDSIYGVPVHNEWLLPDEQSFFSPSFINTNRNLPSPGTASNHHEIINPTSSSNGVQAEWDKSDPKIWLVDVPQNIDSVEQVLSPTPYQNSWTSSQMLNGFSSSPVSYGTTGMEHAIYETGQVMIDGQGFFEPSHHLNDQHQTVYLPDNITFEAHQPAPSPTATPVYTLSIEEPSSSSPGMVCQPDNQYVHDDLASSSNATSYQSKIRGLSADSQVFEPGKQHYGRQESESSDCSLTIDLAYQQYGDSQPITSVNNICVNTNQTIYETWDPTYDNVLQNDRQDGVMLGTNHIGDDSLGECNDGQFYVCYDEENIYTDPHSGLSYPAIHMTDDYLLTVLFKDGVCLEIAVDKSMRLVHHENKLVAAMSGSGEQTCIIHPAARIYQTTSSVHATVYNNRRAKLTDEYVTFGSEKESFRFDQRQITSVDHSKAAYMDLSDDESVKLLQTDDGTPTDNDKLRDKCMEILAHAHFWKHGKNGSTVIINGTKIVQSDKGDVTVNCGPIKFIRMNPTKSVIRLKTQLVEADIETNWTVRLSRGHLALNVIQAGLMVSNGKIKGYLDRDDKLQAFSLPDHRVLMLGQPVPQHRPGVPTRSRRNDHNKKTEPEGDHSGYSRPIVNNDTERGRQGNFRQWETF